MKRVILSVMSAALATALPPTPALAADKKSQNSDKE